MALYYIKHLQNLTSAGPACVSISAFASIIVIPIDIASSAGELNIFVITWGIKKNDPIIIIKKNKHGEIILLAKSKLISIEGLHSRAVIDPCIIHNEFVSKTNLLKENFDMREE